MTLNDYRSVAVMVVPTAMQSAVMSVELGTRAAIVVTIAIIRVSVAADADTETLGARNRRNRNCDGRQGGENQTHLFHVDLLSDATVKTVGDPPRSGNNNETFLNEFAA
jgi:hypothetical protein